MCDQLDPDATPADSNLDIFHRLRPGLLQVAYRLLGSMADAEDVLQDAFLRWRRADRGNVQEPEAFLRQIVTRLALDQLKSARRRREVYVGPWLPEPLVDEPGAPPDVTLPLLLALERLTPLERAAFILHDVFALPFDEVARTLGRDAAACRQLARRARGHVRVARARFAMNEARGHEIAEAFFVASRSGDLARLRDLLAADVVLHTDGGGQVAAPRRPVAGRASVLRLFAGLAPIFKRESSRPLRWGLVGGLPGFVTLEQGDLLQTTALQVAGGRIRAVYVTRNPDKLRHLEGLRDHIRLGDIH